MHREQSFRRICPICSGFEVHISHIDELVHHIRERHPESAHRYTRDKLLKETKDILPKNETVRPPPGWRIRLAIGMCIIFVVLFIYNVLFN